jgi:membrane protein implicated in regulation of membrane protease activity
VSEEAKSGKSPSRLWCTLVGAGLVCLALGGVLAGSFHVGLFSRAVLSLLAAGSLCLAAGVFLVARSKALLARTALSLVLAALALGLVLFAGAVFYGTITIRELLTENKHLREAITNLTREDQIGYARVVSQETRDGKAYTTVKFVETARDNKQRVIVEKEYTVEGDVVHFDALIVKFDNRRVMDGKERALYLWRRVYGEQMAPGQGFPIEQTGAEPKRYEDIFRLVGTKDKEVFWREMWDLANDPDRLSDIGVKAIYGNAVYAKLEKGRLYVFMIGATGQVYPETMPEP